MHCISCYCQILRRISILMLTLLVISCSSSNSTKTVRLAGTASVLDSLVWIANEQGFFKEQGLDVVFKVYPTGKRSLLGMLDNKADVATTADVPFMAQLYKHPDLRLIATVGSADDELKIVTRTDRGILKPENLRGKTIATQEASAVHLFLHLYLLQHYITEKEVTILFMKAEELPVALADGRIDAMSLREPFITKASDLLNGQMQIFSEPVLYRKTYNLVANEAYIKNNPDVIDKLLKGLLKAENFIEHNPSKAKAIMAKLIKTDKDRVDQLWNNFVLKVVLEQDFLLQLQSQKKWLKHISKVDSSNTYLPLFESFYLEALTKVAPERVGLKPVSAGTAR